MPSLWLLSTGDSQGARESCPKKGRLAGVRSFSSGPGLGDSLIEQLSCAQRLELPLTGWMKFSGLVLNPFLPPKSQDTQGYLPPTRTPKKTKVRHLGQSSLLSSEAVVLGQGGGRKALKTLRPAPGTLLTLL